MHHCRVCHTDDTVGTVATLTGRIFTDNVDDVEEESHISRCIYIIILSLIMTVLNKTNIKMLTTNSKTHKKSNKIFEE